MIKEGLIHFFICINNLIDACYLIDIARQFCIISEGQRKHFNTFSFIIPFSIGIYYVTVVCIIMYA